MLNEQRLGVNNSLTLVNFVLTSGMVYVSRCIAMFFALICIAGMALANVVVVDGDTLKVNGINHRIHGIDTPERNQKCGNWPCGSAATQALQTLVEGRQVHCKTHEYDHYGRPVSTCYADGKDVGKSLVAQGLAWAYVKYAQDYVIDEQAAKTRKLGIWSGNYQPAWAYRNTQKETVFKVAEKQIVGPKGCAIKGNISGSGKIYHLPGSRYYKKTRIDTQKGERWFCSEKQALAAGWRAPKR